MFLDDKAYIYMGKVNDPDLLVILADFFLKLVESKWCIISGVYGRRLIVIFRNAGFHLDAGRLAQKLSGSGALPAGIRKQRAPRSPSRGFRAILRRSRRLGVSFWTGSKDETAARNFAFSESFNEKVKTAGCSRSKTPGSENGWLQNILSKPHCPETWPS